MKWIWIKVELYFKSYKFSNFRDFLRFFLKFTEFKIDLFNLKSILCVQVTWQNMERPITRLIMTVDRHLKAGFITWHNIIRQQIILKRFNLNCWSEEL